jgi:hypothetical protein
MFSRRPYLRLRPAGLALRGLRLRPAGLALREDWLPRRIDRFHAATPAVLVQLCNFAILLKNRKFRAVVQMIAGDEERSGASQQLVRAIAAVLRRGRRSGTSDLLEKSVQETLFSSGDCALDQKEFGKNAQAFVRNTGSRGLITLFMEMHLSNLIWTQIDRSSRQPEDLQTLESMPVHIDRLCREAAMATTASWNKWSQFDESSARQVLRHLRSHLLAVLAHAPGPLSKSA